MTNKECKSLLIASVISLPFLLTSCGGGGGSSSENQKAYLLQYDDDWWCEGQSFNYMELEFFENNTGLLYLDGSVSGFTYSIIDNSNVRLTSQSDGGESTWTITRVDNVRFNVLTSEGEEISCEY